VAFVNLAQAGDENFPGFVTLLLDICAATVRSPERFAQTGTGWVLRELSQADEARVVAFIEAQLEQFSAEGLRYATEKLPEPTRKRLRGRR
jgi:3-methyladenine DNA glycosylase AlkD